LRKSPRSNEGLGVNVCCGEGNADGIDQGTCDRALKAL
jgi:hypothetical protein